jgi:hypothetical protein
VFSGLGTLRGGLFSRFSASLLVFSKTSPLETLRTRAPKPNTSPKVFLLCAASTAKTKIPCLQTMSKINQELAAHIVFHSFSAYAFE